MGNVLRYLEDSYGRYPEKCAVTDERRSYTYREFYGLSRRVGSALAKKTGRGQAVGIYMEKNADAVAAFFGVQWAGCFYSVLNTELPGSRLNQIVEQLEVVTPSTAIPVRRLSGGNVQKVLVGREISSSPTVLMAAYPVRGLDINSSYAIYNLLNEQKKKGVAVIFVGEDLDVLLELCDRILVMGSGRITGLLDGRTASKEEIGLLMTKTNGGEENE